MSHAVVDHGEAWYVRDRSREDVAMGSVQSARKVATFVENGEVVIIEVTVWSFAPSDPKSVEGTDPMSPVLAQDVLAWVREDDAA